LKGTVTRQFSVKGTLFTNECPMLFYIILKDHFRQEPSLSYR